MQNYMTCPIEKFEQAMKHAKTMPIKQIPTDELYILHTKYRADAVTAGHVKTAYATGISITSQQKADVYKDELKKRGAIA